MGDDPSVSLPHDSDLPHVVGVYFQLEFDCRKSGTSPLYCFILGIICCYTNTKPLLDVQKNSATPQPN